MHAGRKKKHVEHVHTISTIFDMPVCLSTVHLPGALCNSCSDTRPPVLLHSGTHQLKPLITPPCYLLTPLRALASHALAPYGLEGERLERVLWPRRLRRQQPAFHRSSTTSTASMRRWAPWMRGGSLLITCFGAMRVLLRVAGAQGIRGQLLGQEDGSAGAPPPFCSHPAQEGEAPASSSWRSALCV